MEKFLSALFKIKAQVSICLKKKKLKALYFGKGVLHSEKKN